MKSTDSKKHSSKHTFANKTQFIVSAPTETVIEILTDDSQLFLRELTSNDESHEFEISSDNAAAKVYMSVRSWNITDTLVVVSPTASFSAPRYRLILLLLGAVLLLAAIVAIIASQELLAFIILWFIAILLGMHNYRNGIGRFRKASNTVDSTIFAQEKLMNSIAKVLTDKVEAHIISA